MFLKALPYLHVYVVWMIATIGDFFSEGGKTKNVSILKPLLIFFFKVSAIYLFSRYHFDVI